MFYRSDSRRPDQLRPVNIIPDFINTAAEAMKLVAPDLKELGLIDGVIPEPTGGAHHAHAEAAAAFKSAVLKHLDELCALSAEDLLEQRYAKFRSFGAWQEV